MIAALFVERKGSYADVPDCELWDADRDARLYPGPYPVICHPPCSRWCRLAGLVEARWGHKRGDDGGMFESALASVRRWGGVLEHPAYSDAWARYGLLNPPRSGGWIRDINGGWTCHVEQGRYGHPAKKATWLYASRCELPSLRWGSTLDVDSDSDVSWCGNKVKSPALVGRTWVKDPQPGRALVSKCANNTHPADTHPADTRRRLSSKEASATPPEFRDILIAMARSVEVR